jgi:hypothetical protein
MQSDRTFDKWLAALEARHLADLRFPEVARALRALSSTYVERRTRLREGRALAGAGKRAAFALFYGPLHYLIVHHIATSLRFPPGCATLVDLGCGTGAAGVACANALETIERIVGVDTHEWAVSEAARTYGQFGFRSRTEKADIAATRQLEPVRSTGTRARTVFVSAFTLNELAESSRDTVMHRLLARAQRGDAVLIVEPLAGFVAPWWPRWQQVMTDAGGRADEWRARKDLPEIVARLDRAVRLDHRELTARSLFIA